MKLENQVVSLEIAKRLKELGVKQESLFRYHRYTEDEGFTLELFAPSETDKETEEYISAFTVAELGEMLPADLPFTEGYVMQLASQKLKDSWNLYYLSKEGWQHFTMGDTEADARGKMLIYLLENNLLAPTTK